MKPVKPWNNKMSRLFLINNLFLTTSKHLTRNKPLH